MRVDMVALMQVMRRNARMRSHDGKTGWATYNDVRCAYYPSCRRYAWFTPEGRTSWTTAHNRLMRVDREIRRRAKEDPLS